jgi:hypothetical protein
MSHTALSMSSSPNPQLLEIRILANHAKDERFSFLRGRYKHVWEKVKMEVRQAKREKEKGKEIGLGGLMGDYDSDESEEEQIEDEEIPPEPDVSPPSPPSLLDDQSPPEAAGIRTTQDFHEDEEETKRRIRREKVEEWKRARAQAGST